MSMFAQSSKRFFTSYIVFSSNLFYLLSLTMILYVVCYILVIVGREF